MAFNYTRAVLTANRLLEKFGRPITVIKFNQNLVEPDKPWRAQYISRDNPLIETVLPMVFVELSSAERLGMRVDSRDFAEDIQQVGIAPHPLGDPNNYQECDEIIDEGVRYKIKECQVLQPGPVKLIYFFKIER